MHEGHFFWHRTASVDTHVLCMSARGLHDSLALLPTTCTLLNVTIIVIHPCIVFSCICLHDSACVFFASSLPAGVLRVVNTSLAAQKSSP